MAKRLGSVGQYELTLARQALRDLRAPIDREAAARQSRVAAARAENDRRAREAHARRMAGGLGRGLTWVDLVRRHVRAR